MVNLFLLSLKIGLRELRSGELSVLIAALIIAVASSTTVSILGDRLTRTMTIQAAEFLAADLVVASRDLAPDEWASKAAELGLHHAQTVEFSNVLMERDEILLAGIKAVSDGYPLRGRLLTTQDRSAESEAANIPPSGRAWVEARVLTSLGLSLGQQIEVGEKTFTLDRIITREPDPRGDLYSLSPRVLINVQDLAATRVIQPGSRVHRYELFSGDEAQIRRFKSWLKPQLHPGQRIIDVHEDRPEVGNALKRAQRYLGLTTIAVVLIAGCAIAMSVRRYTERHYDLTAMLKCFGVSGRSILYLYAVQFLVIGTAASAVGCTLGWLLQEIAAFLLRDLLPQHLASPSAFALLFGVATGLLILLGFAMPPILRLGRCTPLRVLRRDLEPSPNSAWTVYGIALAVLGILLWRCTADGRMTAAIMAGGAVAVSLLAGVTWIFLRLVGTFTGRLGLSWRLALRNLSHAPRLAIGQTLAFSITFVAMLLTVLVRTELIQEWQRQLPGDAPNHFALNLFEADRTRFGEFLRTEQVRGSAFYPIVRGRLTAVNGTDVRQRVIKDSTADSAINRDLSLTWSAELPEENVVTEGQWWTGANTPQVSVEEQLAKSLGLRLGDRLTFNIAGVDEEATVASLRKVRWDTMMPNFFMIFEPGSLNKHPHTYLTSFYVPAEKKIILNHLVKQFPSVSLLDVDRLLLQLQSVLKQVAGAIEYVLLFALGAGFTVLFAAVRASLDERLYHDAVLRALGASNRLLRRSLWLEFVSLGFLAGILAAAVAEGITWVLFDRIFDLPVHLHGKFWLITPPLAAAAVGLAGYLNARSLLRKSPVSAFREL